MLRPLTEFRIWRKKYFRSSLQTKRKGIYPCQRRGRRVAGGACRSGSRRVTAMSKETVDEAINMYVTERMAKGKQMAISHFLANLYLKEQSEGILEAMRRVRSLTRYYIDLTKVMLNPFKGPEIAWLASMLNIAIYAAVLISVEEQRNLGISLLSGTLVYGCYLIRNVARKWCDLHVMLAIYDEIVQIADHELESLV